MRKGRSRKFAVAHKNLLLTLLLAFAPLAIGSIHPWSIGICLLGSLALFTLEIYDRGIKVNAPSIGIGGWILTGICIFTIFQLIPLPVQIVKILSPTSADIKTSLYMELLHKSPPKFISITLDSYETMIELMQVMAAVLVFLSVRQRIRKEGSQNVLWCVAFAGMVVSGVYFLHLLAGWQKVYEFYKPLYAPTSPLSAPLLNSNHLSGALGFTSLVSVGLAFGEKEKVKKIIIIVIAGFTGAGAILTLSRGGILSFIGGQILFIVMWLYSRRAKITGKIPAGITYLPMTLAIAVGASVYLAYKSILQEFLHGNTEKLNIPLNALQLIKQFYLTGVGKGSFQVGFTLVQTIQDTATYTSPENFIAQYLVEWGVLAGGAMVVLIAGTIIFGIAKPPLRSRNIGVAAAIFALTVQNLVDFSFEICGVLLPFMAVLASEVVRIENAYGIAHRGSKNTGFTRKHIPGWAGVTVFSAVLITGITCFTLGRKHTIQKDTEKTKALIIQRSKVEEVTKQINQSMQNHPADYYFPLIGGIIQFHRKEGNPLHMLSRALRLFPKSAVAHLYVARTLKSMGKIDQALIEYMEAMKARTSLTRKVCREIVEMTKSFEVARKAAKTTKEKFLLFDPLSVAFLSAGLEGESIKADEAILKMNPYARGAIIRKIKRFIKNKKLQQAMKLINLIESREPFSAIAPELKGEIEEKKENYMKAASHYIEGWKKKPVTENRALLYRAARIYASIGEKKKMYECMREYEQTAPSDTSRGRAIFSRANLEKSLKMYEKALSSYRIAAGYIPDDPAVWKSIAQMAEVRKDVASQLMAYKNLQRLEPENQKWKKKIGQIKSKINQTLLDKR